MGNEQERWLCTCVCVWIYVVFFHFEIKKSENQLRWLGFFWGNMTLLLLFYAIGFLFVDRNRKQKKFKTITKFPFKYAFVCLFVDASFEFIAAKHESICLFIHSKINVCTAQLYWDLVWRFLTNGRWQPIQWPVRLFYIHFFFSLSPVHIQIYIKVWVV